MTIRSPELEEAVLAGLMSGKSLVQVCRAVGMPDRTTVFRWMAADDEFATRCARARVIQADALEDDMASIEDRTLSGELDAAAARVVLSSKQWRASKLAPKKYGEKVQNEISGPDGKPVSVSLEFVGTRPDS